MPEAAQHFRWKDRPLEHLRGGIARRFVTSGKAMLGEVTFRKGDTVPAHAHDNEQFTHVVSGALRFTVGEAGDQVVLVRAGEVILLPSGTPHAVEALEDTIEYDLFTPPRQDWIDPDSPFLREKAETSPRPDLPGQSQPRSETYRSPTATTPVLPAPDASDQPQRSRFRAADDGVPEP